MADSGKGDSGVQRGQHWGMIFRSCLCRYRPLERRGQEEGGMEGREGGGIW